MALLLYIPVLHKGYLDLFARHKNEETLYVIGEGLIKEFPLLEREIRRINPKQIVKIIKALNLFRRVEAVEKSNLISLSRSRIVSADEVEMRELVKKYLPKAKVVFDTSFLRWDAKKVKKNEEVNSDIEVTSSKLANDLIKLADKQSELSSDWFRQVGAILWKDNKILLAAYNKRQPSSHEAYAVGDPRNFVELGTDTHLRQVIHAEQGILVLAAKKGISVNGASIYVTTFPCPDCSALIAASGITECYFRDGYSHLGGANLLKRSGVRIIRVVDKKTP